MAKSLNPWYWLEGQFRHNTAFEYAGESAEQRRKDESNGQPLKKRNSFQIKILTHMDFILYLKLFKIDFLKTFNEPTCSDPG